LVAVGLVGIAVTALMAKESPFARYFLLEALAPERALPLIGLGAACGQVGTRSFSAALLMFGLGILLGSAGQDWLLWVLYNLPGGPIYLFLTGPISCLAIGVALVPGARLLRWLLPISSIVAGAMLSLAIFLNDPSLHEPAFIFTPVLAAFWIVAAVALTVRALRRRWFAIFGRILGSWLVAIGLLHGGASLLPVLKPPPPTTDTSRESTRGAEINRTIPGRPEPEQPAFSPGGFEKPPQP
jgi:hypothetical protein